MEKKKKNPLICPKCNLLHETGDVCVRCNVKLSGPEGSQAPLETKVPESPEKKEVPPPPKKHREESMPELVCPSCKKPYEAGTFCKQCGRSFITPVPSPEKEDLSLPFASESLDELSEYSEGNPSLMTNSDHHTHIIHSMLGKAKTLRRLPIAVGTVILILAVGLYLLLLQPSSGTLPAQESPMAAVPAPDPLSGAAPPVTPSAPSPKEDEIEKIRTLLENIRQANLQENIERFMSCYALDFEDREGKKRSTLDSWKESAYVDLSYTFTTRKVSSETADIQVEWSVRMSQGQGNPPREGRIVLDALLKKEDGGWKIKEIKKTS
jgi:hypothetical protein